MDYIEQGDSIKFLVNRAKTKEDAMKRYSEMQGILLEKRIADNIFQTELEKKFSKKPIAVSSEKIINEIIKNAVPVTYITKKINFSELPLETRTDIVEVLTRAYDNFAEMSLFRDNRSKIEFIEETMGLPKITLRYEDPKKYLKQIRGISMSAVKKYVSMLENGIELHPILVDGNEFVDGSHRLKAYSIVGKNIPVADIGGILTYDWNKDIESAYGMVNAKKNEMFKLARLR